MSKRTELETWAADTLPDLIGVTETWLHPDINDAEIQIPGYSLFRFDREASRGGGVALHVRSNLTC